MHLKRDQISVILSKLSPSQSNNLLAKEQLEKALLEYYVRRHDERIF